MTRLVNVLAWREQRMASRLRFWLIVMSGGVCLVLVMVAWRIAAGWQEGQQQRLLLGHERATLVEAQQMADRMSAKAQEHVRLREAAQQVERREAQTLRWSHALEALVRALPSQAWLSRLEMHQDTLHVEGFARDEAAITVLKKQALSGGLQLIGLGAFMRQKSGEWRFTLTFSTGGMHAATH